MNQKALHQPTTKRKLPLESLFLAIVMAIGLAGIYGLFFQPETAGKQEWKQSGAKISANYAGAEE
ncbi:MAG: hypothetical protein HUU01_17505 [Saprospiraceae bacterium]|nr:hypothetical protein [Saprospiraceae bacterium]